MALEVKFIGEEYSFPEDILEYIFMLNLVEDMQNSLMSSIYNKVYASSMSIIDDSELHDEMRKQASRIIERLCNNGIFSKTIDEYVFENKGYEQYCLVNKNSREAMIRFLSEQMADFQKGLERAYEDAASNITGSGVRVFSSSALTLAATSAMEYSILKKQAKTADEQYQRELSAVSRKGEATKEKRVKEYLLNTYFPQMEQAIGMFVCSMLDRYISDLTTVGKFATNTLQHIDIKRSSNLLKNLTITPNKWAVLKEAFLACPFNGEVYVAAFDTGLLDEDTFEASRIFKQNQFLIDEIKNRIPEITYPSNLSTLIEDQKKNISALVHYSPSGRNIYAILTTPYKNSVVSQYAKIKNLSSNPEDGSEYIQHIIQQSNLDCDDKTLTNLAESIVKGIISSQNFDILVSIHGYDNFVSSIIPASFSELNATSKEAIDAYYIREIANNFRILLDEKKEQIASDLERKAIEEVTNADKKRKQVRITGLIATIALILFGSYLAVELWLFPDVIQPSRDYEEAMQLYIAGNYADAITAFESLGSYKDSINMAIEARYNEAHSLLSSQDFEGAISMFENLGEYKDCATMILETQYQQAIYFANIGGSSYTDAIDILTVLGEYSDSAVRLQKIRYTYASELISQKEYDEAIKQFTNLGTYEDSEEMILECYYRQANDFATAEEYDKAISAFDLLEDYKDSKLKLTQCTYISAQKFMDEKKYSEAIVLLQEIDEYEDVSTKLVECKYELAKQYIISKRHDEARKLLTEIKEYENASTFLELIDELLSMDICIVYRSSEFQTSYCIIYRRIDVNTCTIKLSAIECSTWDNADQNDQTYKIRHKANLYQWKMDGEKILMTFTGSDPSRNGQHSAYREWRISSDWSRIYSRTLLNGSLFGDPGEYDDNWIRIEDDEIAERIINSI